MLRTNWHGFPLTLFSQVVSMMHIHWPRGSKCVTLFTGSKSLRRGYAELEAESVLQCSTTVFSATRRTLVATRGGKCVTLFNYSLRLLLLSAWRCVTVFNIRRFCLQLLCMKVALLVALQISLLICVGGED